MPLPEQTGAADGLADFLARTLTPQAELGAYIAAAGLAVAGMAFASFMGPVVPGLARAMRGSASSLLTTVINNGTKRIDAWMAKAREEKRLRKRRSVLFWDPETSECCCSPRNTV